MNLTDLPDEMRAVVTEDVLDNWFHAAASMMTSIAIMRTIGGLDQEETEDMVRRLSAIVRIGAESLGKTANSSLDTFVEGAMELQHFSKDKMEDLLKHFQKRYIDNSKKSQ